MKWIDKKTAEKIELIATEWDERLDIYIAKKTQLNRSQIQKMLKEGNITVNSNNSKANYKVKEGDIIQIAVPTATELEIKPEQIALDIIYEDDDLIVINKPAGLVVHPAAGNYSGTLVNALLAHCGDNLSTINGEIRPGIVHRIDKDTSGLLVVAKNNKAHTSLAQQLKDKTVIREYLALIHRQMPEPKGIIEAPLGRHPVDRKKMAVVEQGKPAITHYESLERFSNYTLIKAKLETGRTHQIRVHMNFIGHPVVGDPVYGPKKPHFNLKGQLLHAETLGFIHPTSCQQLIFYSPLPQTFTEVLLQLESKYLNKVLEKNIDS